MQLAENDTRHSGELSRCDRAPIDITDSVQPRGSLRLPDPDDLRNFPVDS